MEVVIIIRGKYSDKWISKVKLQPQTLVSFSQKIENGAVVGCYNPAFAIRQTVFPHTFVDAHHYNLQ